MPFDEITEFMYTQCNIENPFISFQVRDCETDFAKSLVPFLSHSVNGVNDVN